MFYGDTKLFFSKEKYTVLFVSCEVQQFLVNVNISKIKS